MRNTHSYAPALLLALHLFGCSGHVDSRQSLAAVRLERYSPAAIAPIYTIECWQDGRVAFFGKGRGAPLGYKTKSISPESVGSLLQTLRAGGVWRLPESEVAPVNDGSTIVISVLEHGESRGMFFYGDFENHPIVDLARAIDDALGTKDFLRR